MMSRLVVNCSRRAQPRPRKHGHQWLHDGLVRWWVPLSTPSAAAVGSPCQPHDGIRRRDPSICTSSMLSLLGTNIPTPILNRSKQCNEQLLGLSTRTKDAPYKLHRWRQNLVRSLWPIEGRIPDSLRFTKDNMVWHRIPLLTCSINPGLLVMPVSTLSSFFHSYWRLQEIFFPRAVWQMKFYSNLHSLRSSHFHLHAIESSHGTPEVTGVYSLLNIIRRSQRKSVLDAADTTFSRAINVQKAQYRAHPQPAVVDHHKCTHIKCSSIIVGDVINKPS